MFPPRYYPDDYFARRYFPGPAITVSAAPVPPTIGNTGLLTEQQASIFLGVDRQTMRLWRVAGIGPSFVTVHVALYEASGLAMWAARTGDKSMRAIQRMARMRQQLLDYTEDYEPQ